MMVKHEPENIGKDTYPYGYLKMLLVPRNLTKVNILISLTKVNLVDVVTVGNHVIEVRFNILKAI